MKTIRQARLLLPGTRQRVYDIDLVDLGGANAARFLVNFRYGWVGAAVEEGTRTPDPVVQDQAERIFDSLVAARQKQGYRPADAAPATPTKPALAAVAPGADARATILATRLRGIDGLADIKAAALLRRIGELRLVALSPQVTTAARGIMLERKRLATLRALPYALHRTDDGSGATAAVLDQLAAHADTPVAETARLLVAMRDPVRAPAMSSLSLALRAAAALPDATLRDAAAVGAIRAGIGPQTDSAEARTAATDLRALYAVSAHDAAARSMLLATLAAVPLQPPLFRALRRVLQVAETIDDGPVLALLWKRFDDERSSITHAFKDEKGDRVVYLGGRSVRIAEEGAKPNARLAYTETTRGYLRRRSWRTLRHLGANGDPAYARIGAEVLLTLVDAEGSTPQPRPMYRRDPQSGRFRHITVRFPAFADRYAPHFIMHGLQRRLDVSERSLRWRLKDGASDRAGETEAPFVDVWTAHPQPAWDLLKTARAGVVASFAARLLSANTAFLDTVQTAEIAALLAGWQPYAERLDLAIRMAERRIAREGLQPELATALISEPTRGGALIKLYFGARPELLASDPPLFAALLAGCAAENFQWFTPLAQQAASAATPDARARTLEATVAAVSAAVWPAASMPRAKALGAALMAAFPNEIAALDGQRIRELDARPELPLQRLAAALAAARPDGARLVDIARLANSADPDLRAAAITLFALRPLEDIEKNLDAVAAFLTADQPEPREAARPIAARLARERPDSARVLADKIIVTLYRTELHEGLRDDVYRVLSQDLRPGVIALGPETAWNLLRARAEPARRLGADVIEAFKPADFSVRQLARIGCNDQVKARRWALAALATRIADVRTKPEEGFALLDSTFEDAREAGYGLYRTQLQAEDWTPDALVALSDATTEPAQRFGREMIGRVFEAKNADILLSRLAEHPATGFRLLVTRLMRDYVKGDVQKLRRLVPAIETTLLQVRRGRAAKDQMYAFLEEQLGSATATMTDDERLSIVASVLEKTVATCAVSDRARALSLLAAVKHRQPGLAPRAVLVPREARR